MTAAQSVVYITARHPTSETAVVAGRGGWIDSGRFGEEEISNQTKIAVEINWRVGGHHGL